MIGNRRNAWYPGSFTKNFSWGKYDVGLQKLHEAIRVGFNNQIKDVKRDVFRSRVNDLGGPDYIPINFFLFNKVIRGENYIIADELVFQAVSMPHTKKFDKLALFAFNFSFSGLWKEAKPAQRHPALWAHYYVIERIAGQFDWQVGRSTADDIERFMLADDRYKAETARKLATNLSFLYERGALREFNQPLVTSWWVDALFLALDRLILDSSLDNKVVAEVDSQTLLKAAHFETISGKNSLEKVLATPHIIALYWRCGGQKRFLPEVVVESTRDALSKHGALDAFDEYQFLHPNDQRPQGAIHPTNARIMKSIPRICAILAKYAGFDLIDADELLNFDIETYIREKANQAFDILKEEKIRPTMSADEIIRLMRDR